MANSRSKWIDTGYELFAMEGAEGIHVERLARMLNLNKSGFYHYFKNHDKFLREVLNHHRALANQLAIEIESCENLDPDYFNAVLNYKNFIFVQKQLIWKMSNPLYSIAMNEVDEIIEKPLLPLWELTFDLVNDLELTRKHFSVFRNAFYMKVQENNLTYEFFHDRITETNNLMIEVFGLLNTYSIKKARRKEPMLTGSSLEVASEI